MVDFSKPAAILAAAIIALFAISMFAVLLSVPTDGQDGIASATPSPAPTRFEGTGRGKARVLALSDQLLVQCDSSDSSELIKLLENHSFVTSAFQISNGVFAVSLNSSVAGDRPAALEALLDLKITTYPFCIPRVLRKATAEFSEAITISDEEGGANRTLSPREINAFSSLAGGPPEGAPAYVLAQVAANDTVQVLVTAQLSGNRLGQWFAQQVENSLPSLQSTTLPVAVKELLPSAFAELDVAWQARGLNTLPLHAQLNSSKNFNLSSLEYAPQNSVELQGVGKESVAAYSSFFRNQSFVSSVLEQETGLVLFVQQNYTGASELAKLVSDNHLNGTLSFPNSTVKVSAAYDNATVSFSEVAAGLASTLGQEARVLREAVLVPQFHGEASKRLAAALPPVIPGRISPNTAPGEVLKIVEVRMLVQDQIVVRAEARELPPDAGEATR